MVAHESNSLCKQAESYYYDLLGDGGRELVSEPIVSHVEKCQHCQERINQLKISLLQADNCESKPEQVSLAVMALKLHMFYIDKPVNCEAVRPFLPTLLEPALKIEIPTPITVHIDHCQRCSEDLETIRRLNLNHEQLYCLSQLFAEGRACADKMQQLYNTVRNIAERAESGVVTIYNIDESAEARSDGIYDDIYAGFPVKVEVRGYEIANAAKNADAISFASTPRRKASVVNLKIFTKIAVAAAILIGAALLINIPVAKAISIDQIYKALESIKNVYISSFAPDQKKPLEEQWVSKELNLYKLKAKGASILWDIRNKVKKTVYLNARPAETTPLSDDEIARIGEKISDIMGLMPFPNISEIPKDAVWSRVTGDSLKTVAKDTDVYDLAWAQRRDGDSITFKRWRFFVNPETNLPLRTEIYVKSYGDSEYTLRLVTVVEYLSNGEIQSVVEGGSF
jgi:hypothetical protein